MKLTLLGMIAIIGIVAAVGLILFMAKQAWDPAQQE